MATAAVVTPLVQRRMPAYFVSHGGPPTMFETQSKPYKAWQVLGKEISSLEGLKGIVSFSAHWEAGTGTGVQINKKETQPLVYDFYGFPANYYQVTFKTHATPALVNKVSTTLSSAGIHVEGVDRGVDHGLFVPGLVMFPAKENGTNLGPEVPFVQVSLPNDSKAESCLAVGAAIEKLRNEGYVVLASGQIVHNLRDYMMGNRATSYGQTFIDAVSVVVNAHPISRTSQALSLTRHPYYKKAHPSPEHLLPFYIAIGAAGEDKGEIVFSKDDGALGWGIYKFA